MFLENLRLKGGAVREDLSFYEIKGPDAANYLYNQTPNPTPVKDGEGIPNVFVTNRGGFICGFYLLKKSDDCFWAVVRSDQKSAFLERLEIYHISEEFEITERDIQYQILVGEKTIAQSYDDEMPYWFYGHRSKIVFNEKPIEVIDGTPLKIFHGFHEKINRKLFTETRYIDFCYAKDKGCFPGQETVAKIVNNRGAALFPCLLKGASLPENSLPKGEYIDSYDNYHLVLLGRESRVNGSKLMLKDNTEREVFTFPFLEEDDTKWAETLCDKAHEMFHKNEVEFSKELLGYAINVKSDYADAYEMLGVILGREDKYPEAINLMQKLSEVDPDSIMAHTNLSLYYMKVGEIEKAEDEKSKAMLKEFEKAGQGVDQEEVKKQQVAELSRKEGMYQQVLEIDPDDFIATFGLGEICFLREEFNKAQKYFEKAKSLNPKHSQNFLLLAKVLMNQKQIDKAKEILQEGVKIAAAQGDMMPANEMQSLLNNL